MARIISEIVSSFKTVKKGRVFRSALQSLILPMKIHQAACAKNFSCMEL